MQTLRTVPDAKLLIAICSCDNGISDYETCLSVTAMLLIFWKTLICAVKKKKTKQKKLRLKTGFAVGMPSVDMTNLFLTIFHDAFLE